MAHKQEESRCCELEAAVEKIRFLEDRNAQLIKSDRANLAEAQDVNLRDLHLPPDERARYEVLYWKKFKESVRKMMSKISHSCGIVISHCVSVRTKTLILSSNLCPADIHY